MTIITTAHGEPLEVRRSLILVEWLEEGHHQLEGEHPHHPHRTTTSRFLSRYGAQYKNTTFAKQGDLGSRVLDPRPTGVLWRAGDVVEVSWAVEANHGVRSMHHIAH